MKIKIIENIKNYFNIQPKKNQTEDWLNKYYIGTSEDGIASFRKVIGKSIVHKGENYIDKTNDLLICLTIRAMDDKGLQFENVYDCKVKYTHTGRPNIGDTVLPNELDPLQGFRIKDDICVVAQFDLERMKKEEAYTEFILTKLFDKARIKSIHEYTFEHRELSYGNYIGSVMQIGKELSITMNDPLGKRIGNQSMSGLKENYDIAKKKVEEFRNKENRIESLEKRIDELNQVKEHLEQVVQNRKNNIVFSEVNVTSPNVVLPSEEVVKHSK